ncbi:hypothetical protein DPMN_186253 [Dreissena polymorpha]|uniref:Uncharacterized protein n=1 Tax=Dreissena polymorpha TaxID=45954 RepID=A0A9D4DQ42_DREPO|nr:hypothetical protein DPMN_186253 [Dreissena polymorpha]
MEKPVHRDILDGDDQEIAAHLMDLIKNEYQRTHDFMDVCMQIQHVCSQHLLSDLVTVIEFIVNNVPIERVSQIFCVFAFGELHGDLRRLNNSYQHTLSALSASLATTEVSKFPSNSYTNLVNISRKIFQLVRGESYTLCCYLDMFYHFLGSKGVSSIIEEIATGKCREMIAIDDNKHSEYVERIAGNLLKGDTPSIDQLEKLVRHLPLNLASGLYKIAVESMDPILGQRVKEGLRANAHTALDKAKHKHDMDMITSLNSSFEKLDLNLDERFRDFVERVIVQEIAYPWAAGDPKKRGSDSLIHSFLKMLDETACFKEDSSKVELVKSLALSPNPECRQMFLKVAQLTKFRVVYDNLESDTYVLWLENEMRLCREDKIKALFAKFLSLLAVGLPKNKVLEDALRQVALKDMKAMRIEELLKSTSSIEKMCDDETFLFDIYRTEVVEVLRKRWGKKPVDVLLQICTDVNDAKKLRINSRYVFV